MANLSSGSFIVVAKTSGRGMIKPFGVYGKQQAGAMVRIGDNSYKVTPDGRVNIPKKIMETYGKPNADGRNVIQMNFRSERGKTGWKQVTSMVSQPSEGNINKKTGDKTHKYNLNPDIDELIPSDSPDFYSTD